MVGVVVNLAAVGAKASFFLEKDLGDGEPDVGVDVADVVGDAVGETRRREQRHEQKR